MKTGIDNRLVASVQMNAGGDIHLAANLLSCYKLAAHLWRRACELGDDPACRSARDYLGECETELRRFLSQCRRPPREHAYT